MPGASAPKRQNPSFQRPRYIAIEGPIRVGKSTLAQILAEKMQARRIHDPEDNPFLSDFYREKPGAAFRAQMYFLVERYRRLREIHPEETAGAVVSDFVFEKDKIFAYVNLDDSELKVYEQYFELFAEQTAKPDLVIYLQAKPEVLQQRIAKKADPAEKQIALEYLREIVQAYEHFFFRYAGSNLLVVNTSEIDFVERNQDLQVLLKRIEEPVKGTQYFLPLA